MGASAKPTGLAGPEGLEPHSRLHASHGIPSPVEVPILSMWQPFASLVFAWDRERGDFAKCNETRGWPLPKHLIGKPIGIQATAKFPAAKYISRDLNDLCYDLFGCGYNYSLPFGAIIGIVRFGAPVPTGEAASFQPDGEIAAGDWTTGRWAFPIIEAEALAVPIPAQGKQGWWKHLVPALPIVRGEAA